MATSLQDVLNWMQSPERSQQMQGVGGLFSQALNKIQEGRQANQQTWNEAFADPNDPLKVTNYDALHKLGEQTMSGPMGFAPVGMIGARFKGSGATPTEVPGFGPAKEIQDTGSTINSDVLKNLMENGGNVRLSDVLNHPSLYRDYPELAKYPIERLGNVWSALTGQLAGLKGMYAEGSFYLPYTPKSLIKENEVHSTLLHEVQHAVQALDKMPEGSMAEQYFAKSAAKARDKIKTLKSAAYTELTSKLKDKGYEPGTIWDIAFDNNKGKELIKTDKDIAPIATFYQKLQKSEYKLDKKYDEAFDKYKRTAGEAQARAVQKRFENPSEYAKPVTESYDVPIDSLVYRDPMGNTIK